jgi:hypothetical protein
MHAKEARESDIRLHLLDACESNLYSGASLLDLRHRVHAIALHLRGYAVDRIDELHRIEWLDDPAGCAGATRPILFLYIAFGR